jgi:heme exporter protein C
VVGLIAAIDIPIVHFSVEWWRGLHQQATIGAPDRVLNPAAPWAFVLALLLMLAAFSVAWLYLMLTRYELARLEQQREDEQRDVGLQGARAAAATR